MIKRPGDKGYTGPFTSRPTKDFNPNVIYDGDYGWICNRDSEKSVTSTAKPEVGELINVYRP